MSTQSRNDDDSELREEEEEEVLKLEEEVKTMAEKIVEYRTTLPNQLTSTLTSLLASQRPVLPDLESRTVDGSDSQAGASQDVVRAVESGNVAALSVRMDQEEEAKIKLLKQKISSNASTMHIVMQRMKEYMARIDKLESFNGVIHPSFKRKRTG